MLTDARSKLLSRSADSLVRANLCAAFNARTRLSALLSPNCLPEEERLTIPHAHRRQIKTAFSERGQPCPREPLRRFQRADKAVRAPIAQLPAHREKVNNTTS